MLTEITQRLNLLSCNIFLILTHNEDSADVLVPLEEICEAPASTRLIGFDVKEKRGAVFEGVEAFCVARLNPCTVEVAVLAN